MQEGTGPIVVEDATTLSMTCTGTDRLFWLKKPMTLDTCKAKCEATANCAAYALKASNGYCMGCANDGTPLVPWDGAAMHKLNTYERCRDNCGNSDECEGFHWTPAKSICQYHSAVHGDYVPHTGEDYRIQFAKLRAAKTDMAGTNLETNTNKNRANRVITAEFLGGIGIAAPGDTACLNVMRFGDVMHLGTAAGTQIGAYLHNAGQGEWLHFRDPDLIGFTRPKTLVVAQGASYMANARVSSSLLASGGVVDGYVLLNAGTTSTDCALTTNTGTASTSFDTVSGTHYILKVQAAAGWKGSGPKRTAGWEGYSAHVSGPTLLADIGDNTYSADVSAIWTKFDVQASSYHAGRDQQLPVSFEFVATGATTSVVLHEPSGACLNVGTVQLFKQPDSSTASFERAWARGEQGRTNFVIQPRPGFDGQDGDPVPWHENIMLVEHSKPPAVTSSSSNSEADCGLYGCKVAAQGFAADSPYAEAWDNADVGRSMVFDKGKIATADTQAMYLRQIPRVGKPKDAYRPLNITSWDHRQDNVIPVEAVPGYVTYATPFAIDTGSSTSGNSGGAYGYRVGAVTNFNDGYYRYDHGKWLNMPIAYKEMQMEGGEDPYQDADAPDYVMGLWAMYAKPTTQLCTTWGAAGDCTASRDTTAQLTGTSNARCSEGQACPFTYKVHDAGTFSFDNVHQELPTLAPRILPTNATMSAPNPTMSDYAAGAYAAEHCIDDDFETRCHRQQDDPWLRIDLGASYSLAQVSLYNQVSGNRMTRNKLGNHEIWVSETSNSDFEGTAAKQKCFEGTASDTTSSTTGKAQVFEEACVATGRYVWIILPGSSRSMSLAEVRVIPATSTLSASVSGEIFAVTTSAAESIPFTQAADACAALDARVCTLAEMSSAQQKNGADWCTCSFVADDAGSQKTSGNVNTAFYPMQFNGARSSCALGWGYQGAGMWKFEELLYDTAHAERAEWIWELVRHRPESEAATIELQDSDLLTDCGKRPNAADAQDVNADGTASNCPVRYDGISTFAAGDHVLLGSPSELGINIDASFTMMAWVMTTSAWEAGTGTCIFCAESPMRPIPAVDVWMSTTYGSADDPYPASNVIDGNLENFCHTVHTGGEDQYLVIDLGARYSLAQVNIYNRVTSDTPTQNRLGVHEIWVSDFATKGGGRSEIEQKCFEGTASDTTSTTTGNAQVFEEACVATGRYVWIVLPGTNRILNLAEVRVISAPPPLFLTMRDDGSALNFASNVCVSSDTSPSPSTWTHVAYVYDKGASMMYIYWDGVLQQECTLDAPLATTYPYPGDIYAGRPSAFHHSPTGFVGQMAAVQISGGEAKGASAIQEIMLATNPLHNDRLTGTSSYGTYDASLTGPIATDPFSLAFAGKSCTHLLIASADMLKWRVVSATTEALIKNLEEADLLNNCGFDPDYTASNCPVRSKDPQGGRISTFAAGDHVLLGSPSELGITDASYTIMAWIKGRNPKWNGGHGQCIFCAAGEAVKSSLLHISMATNGGDSENHFGTVYNDCNEPNVPANPDSWTHVAYVYDKAARTMDIYWDGVHQGSCTDKDPYIGTSDIYAGPAGADNWANWDFVGQMSAVQISGGEAKGASAIQEIMLATSPRCVGSKKVTGGPYGSGSALLYAEGTCNAPAGSNGGYNVFCAGGSLPAVRTDGTEGGVRDCRQKETGSVCCIKGHAASLSTFAYGVNASAPGLLLLSDGALARPASAPASAPVSHAATLVQKMSMETSTAGATVSPTPQAFTLSSLLLLATGTVLGVAGVTVLRGLSRITATATPDTTSAALEQPESDPGTNIAAL
jgi:hypothetical protein